jgi:hypothetical protein
LYDPLKKKILISRDVLFEENKAWLWNEKVHKKVNQETTSEVKLMMKL